MATVEQLTAAIQEISTDLDRVVQLVNDLHTSQGVPESALEPVLNALEDVRTKAAGIV